MLGRHLARITTSLALCAGVSLFGLAGCASSPGSGGGAKATSTAEKPSVEVGTYYGEESHDGRLYVFGKPDTHEQFRRLHHMPYTRTKIGYAADGRTVVFEVDKKVAELADWLEAEYSRRHAASAVAAPVVVHTSAANHRAGATTRVPTAPVKARAYTARNWPGSRASQSTTSAHSASRTYGSSYGRSSYGAASRVPTYRSAAPARSTTSTAARPAAGPYYQELRKDGRIYVFGKPTTHASFLKNGHMPYTRTKIGYSADGSTVVFEVDKKDGSLADRLESAFNARHPAAAAPAATSGGFYEEMPHDGRVYVFGSATTRDAFRKVHHMPYTRTLIGYAADGRTVVFEVDKKDPALAERLESEYARRHGIAGR